MNHQAIAPFDEDFEKAFGPVSLAFSLFLLAPPSACLKMMEEGSIKDLNETNAKSVSLLALKLTNSSDNVLPTWGQWVQHQKDVKNAIEEGSPLPELWDEQTLARGPSSNILCASMIFAGADPWKTWDPADFNTVSSCFLAHAVEKDQVGLVKLLLSHPNCPEASELDSIRFKKVSLRADGYSHYFQGLEDVPLIHYAANRSNKNMLELFVQKGMDVNVLDGKGRTPLFYVQEPDNAKMLLENNASADTKDEDGKNVGMFWKTVFSTAAKQSDFNKLLIEKLKDKMSPDEIREIQKPSLFNEVRSGTKTAFEGIYRKSKFSPDVTLEEDGVVTNIITQALLRGDEKTPIFIRWGQEKNVSWDHVIDQKTPCLTNAMLNMILLSSNHVEKDAKTVLNQAYAKQNVKDFYHDVLQSLKASAHPKIAPTNALCFLVFHDRVNEDQKAGKPTYQRRYSAGGFSSFAQAAHEVLGLGVNEKSLMPFVIQNHPLYLETLSAVLRSASLPALDEKRSGYRATPFQDEDFVVFSSGIISQCNSSENPEAIRALAWLLVSSYAFGFAEKSYYNKEAQTPLMSKRQEIIALLKNVPILPLDDGELMEMQEILDKVAARPETTYSTTPETLPQAISLISASQIRGHIKEKTAPSASKRRM